MNWCQFGWHMRTVVESFRQNHGKIVKNNKITVQRGKSAKFNHQDSQRAQDDQRTQKNTENQNCENFPLSPKE